MYGTGMDPYTLSHYHNVARKMNNYVAASAYHFYSGRDRVPMGVYQPAFYSGPTLGNRFANGLNAVGLSGSVVNLGYRFGELINGYM
jgi:hypothetical protein